MKLYQNNLNLSLLFFGHLVAVEQPINRKLNICHLFSLLQYDYFLVIILFYDIIRISFGFELLTLTIQEIFRNL